MTNPNYVIYTDGGARGNPGPAAIGVTIQGDTLGLKEYGEYIGQTTNNIAEYKAVIFGLHKLKLLIGGQAAGKATVEVRADSQLMVKQMTGHYKIKEPTIQELFIELWNLKLDFADVDFVHVPREQNTGADRMVNWALDQELDRLV